MMDIEKEIQVIEDKIEELQEKRRSLVEHKEKNERANRSLHVFKSRLRIHLDNDIGSSDFSDLFDDLFEQVRLGYLEFETPHLIGILADEIERKKEDIKYIQKVIKGLNNFVRDLQDNEGVIGKG